MTLSLDSRLRLLFLLCQLLLGGTPDQLKVEGAALGMSSTAMIDLRTLGQMAHRRLTILKRLGLARFRDAPRTTAQKVVLAHSIAFAALPIGGQIL